MRGRNTRRLLLTFPPAGAPAGLTCDARGHQSHLRSPVPQDTRQCRDLGKNPTEKDVQGMKSKHCQLYSDEADWKAQLAPWSDGLVPKLDPSPHCRSCPARAGLTTWEDGPERIRAGATWPTCWLARPPSHRDERGGMGGGACTFCSQ